MKPAPFAYERPGDMTSALALLAETGGKIIAGGQSLGPMLNLRLVEPQLVVDITGLAELKQAERNGDELVLGACITHADIEDGRIPDLTRGALEGVAANIAYRAVRNRGTLGGSLSHADPAADWVSALSALGAKITLRGRNGARKVEIDDFVVGALETLLSADEIAETIHIPARPSSAHWGYFKSCRKTGDFAHAIAAILIDPGAATARVVIGAIEKPPIVMKNPVELFGGRITGDYKSCFDVCAADAILTKAGLDNAAQRHILVNVLKRAVHGAAA
jgi:aerobic carbon-monoxide dehydrogenase medium subunit